MQGRPPASPRMNTATIPDLLNSTPMACYDLELANEVLRFAFSAGGSDVTEAHKMKPLRVAFSTWDPACFEADLFVSQFVKAHSSIDIHGQSYQLDQAHLRRLLTHPPEQQATTLFRQHILYELVTNTAARAQLELAYARASRIFSLLEDSGLGHHLALNRRRVDVLRAVRELIDGLAGSFQGTRSGLGRMQQFGERMMASEGYERLRNVTEIERKMASIDARIQLGYEGEIRHFEIVGVSEQTLNPFYATRIGRLLRRLILLVRGYRFSDTEVLSQFVDDVFYGVSEELAQLFQLFRDMEFYLAALHFHDEAARHGLRVCLPKLASMQPGVACERTVQGLFNPLLVGNGRSPTTCTLSQKRHSDIAILTGANSGGKTRVLQALSYCQMLGQAGFFVPAAGASLVWAGGMFLSIGERTEAAQKEGRLGMELVRIRQVFEHARVGAFVVVDELCSGTNPEEGQEIFRMVVGLMQKLHLQALVSTHFLEFARELEQQHAKSGPLVFLRAQVDAANLPTYQFEAGVAKSSLAHHVAARLGVTRGELQTLVARRQKEFGVKSDAAEPVPAARVVEPNRIQRAQ
jgi:DNA mismatch repair protein MutS2